MRQAAKWHPRHVQGREFGQLEKLVLIQFRNVVVVKIPAVQTPTTSISSRNETERWAMHVNHRPSAAQHTRCNTLLNCWQGIALPNPMHRRKRVHPRGQPPTNAQHPSPPQRQERKEACMAAFKVTYKVRRLVVLSKRVGTSSVMALP